MEKLTDISNIKYLLTIFAKNQHAKKHFGQNFLTSEHVLEQILKTAEISEKDIIVEIGPGLGVLTQELVKLAKKVISIEMDPDMIHILRNTIAREPTAKNLTILEQDALKFNISANTTLNHEPYKLVANLPYNVATPLLKNFLVDTHAQNARLNLTPTRIVVLVQKEVAEKICAKTGNHSVLSLTIQPFGTPKIITHVSPSSFYPPPKITSTILLIEPHKIPLLTTDLATTYFRLIHAAFSQKRKTLLNSLQQILQKQNIEKILSEAKIDPTTRPQNLALNQWIVLSSLLTTKNFQEIHA